MARPIKILIVDDEEQSRSLVNKLLQASGAEIVVADSPGVDDALAKIENFLPDLVFLDVQLNRETAFELLNKLSEINFEIIFITAYSEFAVKAFRYSALDYLLKPVDAEEFDKVLEKAIKKIREHADPPKQQVKLLQQHLRSNNKIADKIAIPTSEGILFVSINDILYCHAVGNYTEFYIAGQQKITSSHTLGFYGEWLTGHNFFRAHRSFLINLSHIKMYRRGEGGSILMNDGQEIELSRNNKDAFLKLFKE